MCAVAPSLAGVPGGAYAGLHYYFCRKGWFAFARSKRDRTRNRGGRFRIPGVSSKLLKAHGWIGLLHVLLHVPVELHDSLSRLRMATRQPRKCELLKAHGWITYCTFLSVALARLTLGGFEGKRLLLPTGSAS